MKWFKHDSDASIDAKLQTLLLDYGAAGYGLYWYCVELIAQGVGENNITFELEHDARIIARNLNLSVAETQDMMRKMIELNLFSINENNKLACYALAKRLDQSMTSNQGMRNLIATLKSKNHDKVMTKSEESHDKVKTDKNRREEIREKENINTCASLTTEIVEPNDFDLFWSAYPKKVGKDKALIAWKKKKNKPSIQEILEAVQRYKLSKTVRDGFVCHPTTWINEGRWSDELDTFQPREQLTNSLNEAGYESVFDIYEDSNLIASIASEKR